MESTEESWVWKLAIQRADALSPPAATILAFLPPTDSPLTIAKIGSPPPERIQRMYAPMIHPAQCSPFLPFILIRGILDRPVAWTPTRYQNSLL